MRNFGEILLIGGKSSWGKKICVYSFSLLVYLKKFIFIRS